jgi:hypothetical protein
MVPTLNSSEKDFIPKAGKRKINSHGLSSKNKLISPKPASNTFQFDEKIHSNKPFSNKKVARRIYPSGV